MHCLISYDISENKPRNKISKILLGYGNRVQKSVFEAIITKKDFEEMQERIKPHIDESCDSIRVYFLCEACTKKIGILGNGQKIERLGFVII